jgi:hypothetical protein
MKKVGKIVLWVFIGIVAIGVIGAIINPQPAAQPTNNKQTTDKKEAPTPKPEADTSEITMEEFKQIQNGLSLKQVEEIIGGKGELQSSAGDGQFKSELYMWKGNTFGGNANVTFQDGKVAGKAQFGLE